MILQYSNQKYVSNCNCLCSWLPVHIMGFLLNASHVWQTSRYLFLRVHSWNSARGKPCGRGWICEHLFPRRVSLRVSLWDWRDHGKKEQFHNHRKHKWTNCISRYCKVSLLVVHHIAFHSLEPLSRQESASHKDCFINTFDGFSCSTVGPHQGLQDQVNLPLRWKCWLKIDQEKSRRWSMRWGEMNMSRLMHIDFHDTPPSNWNDKWQPYNHKEDFFWKRAWAATLATQRQKFGAQAHWKPRSTQATHASSRTKSLSASWRIQGSDEKTLVV